jgi:hypothetical protein
MKPKECTNCGRAVSDSFICRRCGRELRALLIGSTDPDGQPGIVWYVHRLRETAYRQARMERALGSKSSRSGYALLPDSSAITLLAKISGTLARWNDDLTPLISSQKTEKGRSAVVVRPNRIDGLETRHARLLASYIPLLRHNYADAHLLLRDMLEYARQAWRIINRPDDICCGPCPNVVRDRASRVEVECGAMLYAEEFEDGQGKRVVADTVQCPKCRARHDVSTLRDMLKQQTRDSLFTGPELLALMENRLNDRMPKTSFYQLIRDGRLQVRGYRLEDGVQAPMYTYNDVCEAREKPKPGKGIGIK